MNTKYATLTIDRETYNEISKLAKERRQSKKTVVDEAVKSLKKEIRIGN